MHLLILGPFKLLLIMPCSMAVGRRCGVVARSVRCRSHHWSISNITMRSHGKNYSPFALSTRY